MRFCEMPGQRRSRARPQWTSKCFHQQFRRRTARQHVEVHGSGEITAAVSNYALPRVPRTNLFESKGCFLYLIELMASRDEMNE